MLLKRCPSKVHPDLSDRWSDIGTSNKHPNALIRYCMGVLNEVILQRLWMYFINEANQTEVT